MPNYKKSTKKLLKEEEVPAQDMKKKTGSKIQPKQMSKAVKNKLSTAPINDLKFIEALIRTGNATKSAMKVFNIKDKYRATHKALDLKKKYKPILREMLINYVGSTEPYYFKKLFELTNAETVYMTKQGIEKIPDNKTRLSALKELGEILDIKENKQTAGQQNNILIVQNKEKGVFEIQAGNDN